MDAMKIGFSGDYTYKGAHIRDYENNWLNVEIFRGAYGEINTKFEVKGEVYLDSKQRRNLIAFLSKGYKAPKTPKPRNRR